MAGGVRGQVSALQAFIQIFQGELGMQQRLGPLQTSRNFILKQPQHERHERSSLALPSQPPPNRQSATPAHRELCAHTGRGLQRGGCGAGLFTAMSAQAAMSGSDSEAFAPDEDFLEADQEASTELGASEEPIDEYSTEDEEVVSADGGPSRLHWRR